MTNALELNAVLQHYNLIVEQVEEYPSYYILKTNRGQKLLRSWNDFETINWTFEVREAISRAGFRKLDRFIRTKHGDPFVFVDNIGYFLTDWNEGVIPSVTKAEQMKLLANTLAELHLAMSSVQIEPLLQKDWEPWSKHFERGIKHIEEIERAIAKKKEKTKLDDLVLSNLSTHQKQINDSVKLAKIVEANADLNNQPTICLGKVQLNNFRIDSYGEAWLFDLGIPIHETPAYDLAKLSIQLYQKSQYQDEIVIDFFDQYQSIRPLEQSERQWILTYLNYPHDLWKFLYVNYIARVPVSKYNPENQYQQLLGVRLSIEQLYESLYRYFKG